MHLSHALFLFFLCVSLVMCLFTKFFHFLLYLFFYASSNCFYSTFYSFPLSLTSCLCLFFFRSQLMMLHKTFHSSRLFQCPDVGRRRRLHFWLKCSLLVQRVQCVNAVQFSSVQTDVEKFRPIRIEKSV